MSQTEKTAREARLAAALRENLRKRKTQTRARAVEDEPQKPVDNSESGA